ncbi:TPA: LOW QUALITY PROTEIN: hypothetical protein N0F65_007251, partial [Lagenidium giganteum]
TRREEEERAAQYARAWGLVDTTSHKWSHWTSNHHPAAGVAILINPNSAISTVEPWEREQWTPYWMAVTCTFLDVSWLLVNVYCPSTRADKSAFYQHLQSLQLPEGPILTGGDFNACAHDYDRRHGLTSAITCPDLIRWEKCWDIGDGLCWELNEETNDDSRAEFAAQRRTYHYSVDGQLRSARLDRWYTSVHHAAWVNEIVTLEHHPTISAFAWSCSILTGAPQQNEHGTHTLTRSPFIRDLQTAAVAEFLVQATPSILAITDKQEIIDAWETIKVAARTLCFKVAAQGRRRQRQSYMQRLKQLERRYREAVCFALRQQDEAGTVQGITKRMAALALVEPGSLSSGNERGI